MRFLNSQGMVNGGLRILIASEVDIPGWVLDNVLRQFRRYVAVDYVKLDLKDIKEASMNVKRGQLNAEIVLRLLEDRVEGYDYDMVVFVIDGDGYVEGLNFVFGIARIYGKVALVFTHRLKANDEYKYFTRLVKEINHELGHTLGLNHCPNPRCVMRFSNSVLEVDFKGIDFCNSCSAKVLKAVAERLHTNPK